MKIIPRQTQKQKYEREYRRLEMHPLKTDDDFRLFYQVQAALLLVRWFELNRRPLCEHDVPKHACIICGVEQPYNPRLDIEAPAVQ